MDSLCIEAGQRSPRLDRSKEKKQKRGVTFKTCSLPGWPAELQYTHTPDLAGLSPGDRRLIRMDYLPGVTIKKIEDRAHPAYGQNGLFASMEFAVGDVLGEYTGKIVPGHCGGNYVTRLWSTGQDSDYFRPGVDAEVMGNELRMINDYRGVPGANGPNCKFSRTTLRGYRAALIVATRTVSPGEEFLLDYGDVYWHGWRPAHSHISNEPEETYEDGTSQNLEERTVSAVLPEDLEALENELREMVSQATEESSRA